MAYIRLEQSKTQQTSEVPASPGKRVPFQVTPGWAHDAVSLTSTSLEVSFEQLRNLYYQLLDQNGTQTPKEDSVTITLKPKLQGRDEVLNMHYPFFTVEAVTIY